MTYDELFALARTKAADDCVRLATAVWPEIEQCWALPGPPIDPDLFRAEMDRRIAEVDGDRSGFIAVEQLWKDLDANAAAHRATLRRRIPPGHQIGDPPTHDELVAAGRAMTPADRKSFAIAVWPDEAYWDEKLGPSRRSDD